MPLPFAERHPPAPPFPARIPKGRVFIRRRGKKSTGDGHQMPPPGYSSGKGYQGLAGNGYTNSMFGSVCLPFTNGRFSRSGPPPPVRPLGPASSGCSACMCERAAAEAARAAARARAAAARAARPARDDEIVFEEFEDDYDADADIHVEEVIELLDIPVSPGDASFERVYEPVILPKNLSKGRVKPVVIPPSPLPGKVVSEDLGYAFPSYAYERTGRVPLVVERAPSPPPPPVMEKVRSGSGKKPPLPKRARWKARELLLKATDRQAQNVHNVNAKLTQIWKATDSAPRKDKNLVSVYAYDDFLAKKKQSMWGKISNKVKNMALPATRSM